MFQNLSQKDVLRRAIGFVRFAAFAWIAAAGLLTTACVWVDKDKDAPDKVEIHEKDGPDKVVIQEKEQPTTTNRVTIEEHKSSREERNY